MHSVSAVAQCELDSPLILPSAGYVAARRANVMHQKPYHVQLRIGNGCCHHHQAALFCFREEAAALPDVVTAPEGWTSNLPKASLQERSALEDTTANGQQASTGANVSASPAWVSGFMHEFRELRLKLQRY